MSIKHDWIVLNRRKAWLEQRIASADTLVRTFDKQEATAIGRVIKHLEKNSYFRKILAEIAGSESDDIAEIKLIAARALIRHLPSEGIEEDRITRIEEEEETIYRS